MVRANLPWMTTNLVLAAVPVVLAFFLFWREKPKTARWWVGVVAFVAFLPNAPYVLTDVIHLRDDLEHATRARQSVLLVVEYAGLMGLGLLFYGIAVALLRRRLLAEGHARWRWPVEFALHAVCAVGIFLGRFMRLNSWDLVIRPGEVFRYVRIPHPTSLAIIAITFFVLLVAALAMRVPLAIHELRRAHR